ncbi:hypothetical protein G6F40_013681 [Rhizopus arrhizus]|nr:hypothetical protein G6F40_013681 [Rhizopus arrhizus]
MLQAGVPGATYNVGGWNEKTNLDLVRGLCALLDERRPRADGQSNASQIVHVPDRAGHDRRYAVDATRLQRDLGWIPAETFESGIRKTVQWYLDEAQWRNRVKILLLGKAGQIGQELRHALPALGEVVPLGHGDVDLRDQDALLRALAAHRPDVIVNAAAYTAVDQAETDREAADQVNAQAVTALAQYAKDASALLVHYSTDYVFDGDSDQPYTETDTPRPLNVYGATKLGGESAVLESGCDALVFRCSWVYAPHGRNFPTSILRLARTRDRLDVVADQIGAPTSASLIADVTAQAVARH